MVVKRLIVGPRERRINSSASFDIVEGNRNPNYVSSCDKLSRPDSRSYMVIKSVNWRNTLCAFEFSAPNPKIAMYIKLRVKMFIFTRPRSTYTGLTMFTDDLSLHECQYGGLHIYVNSGENHITHCTNTFNLEVGSESSWISYTLSWFSGYSQSELSVKYTFHFCRTVDASLSPAWHISGTSAMITLGNFCTKVLCPRPTYESQLRGIVQLGSPSLGPTQISIGQTSGLKNGMLKLK